MAKKRVTLDVVEATYGNVSYVVVYQVKGVNKDNGETTNIHMFFKEADAIKCKETYARMEDLYSFTFVMKEMVWLS